MTQDTLQKESPRDLLREIVREQIQGSLQQSTIKKNRLIFAGAASLCLGLISLVISGLSMSIATSLNPLPPASIVSEQNKSPDYHLERIVGMVTALMAMADNQVSPDELNYALTISSKRQADTLGGLTSFTPNVNTAWLDRQMTLSYLNASLAYLKSNDPQYLSILDAKTPVHFDLEVPESTSAEGHMKATFLLISKIQESVDAHQGDKTLLYQDIKALGTIWVNRNPNDPGAIPNELSPLYQGQIDRIMSLLDYQGSVIP